MQTSQDEDFKTANSNQTTRLKNIRQCTEGNACQYRRQAQKWRERKENSNK
jgi:hypothetical protein